MASTEKKCVIVTRESKNILFETSIDYQKQVCENYAKEHDLEVKGHYSITGTLSSAAKGKRLVKELVRDIKKNGNIRKIICSDVNRLGSNKDWTSTLSGIIWNQYKRCFC